jgi:hypothetical protein
MIGGRSIRKGKLEQPLNCHEHRWSEEWFENVK